MSRFFLALALSTLCLASERRFDVKDDIYAFPQYDVSFSNEYILDEDAAALLGMTDHKGTGEEDYHYEYMVGNGRPYLCKIPQVLLQVNETEDAAGSEAEHDLIAAADRGWQSLKDMEGQQCLYYTTGWWSYMFCYNSYVKQYHALPASQTRQWPPAEDPNTPSYVLGTYDSINNKKATIDGPPKPEAGDLQTQSETTFLVQKLDDGTPCDLTGKPRKVEVQYHCSPGTQDRIGWIKETATCAYQMVVYTSRLCNDVVFQPPKQAHLNQIECTQILTHEEIGALSSNEIETPQIDDRQNQRTMVGRIELGGRRFLGADTPKLERGRVVLTPEEQAEIVIMRQDGQIQGLSSAELKKLDLNPEDIAAFQKEIQKIAGNSDWKIERLGADAHGQRSLRGVVDAKNKKGGSRDSEKVSEEGEDEESGSEEQFKHEI